MLDPLTALSVAGNIVQFVDFSTKLVAKGAELYNSAYGASIGHAELEVIVNDLQELNSRLQPSPLTPDTVKNTWTAEDTALHKLTEQCSTVARELLQALKKLKVEGTSNRRWKSVRQALKGLIKKDEVDAIVQRLQHFRDELNLHILVSMRDTLDMQAVKQTEGFRNLDEVAKDLVDKLDKDQLQLRGDLKGHTDRLGHGQYQTNELIRREHEQTRRTILTSIQSQPLLRHYRDTEGPRKLEQEERDPLIESLILSSLSFSTMENRFEEIEPAHRKTFEWIFQPPGQHSKWSDFTQWLSEGKGIYWINGKPASGKSTLMRFICDNRRTATLIQKWSKPNQLIMTNHFFWNSGIADQRSYAGLLRALLFKILNQSRHLIRIIFPDKWPTHQGQFTKTVSDLEAWTLPRLKKAFEHLFKQAGHELRFCLFVDGLDEYDGDSFDMIELFAKISKFPNVKLCLSSRPLYDFVRMFRSFPTLRLQDLNSIDIKHYVDDELGDNHLMQELQRKEPEQAPKLALEIIDKADGVFLWVRLVVLSLLRGLRNSDHVSDLQRRLLLLPPSLEDLFSHILGRLEPVYLEQSSRIFQIFTASRLSDNPLTSLQLSFAEEPDAESLLFSRTEPLSDAEQESRIELVDIWLVTRCGGLIEASGSHGFNVHLSYLHRTVQDFLELPQVWSRIVTPTRNSSFNPHVSLLKSNILFIKLVLLPSGIAESTSDKDLTEQNFIGSLLHARQAELQTNQAEGFLLDKLAKVMEQINRRNNDIGARDINFLAYATRNGLYYYLAHKIHCDPSLVSMNPGRPLLHYTVHENLPMFGDLHLSSRVVGLLLRNGFDSNATYEGDCAWRIILREFKHRPTTKCDSYRLAIERDRDSSELLKIIKLLIENGAPVNPYLFSRISGFLMNHFSKDRKELQAIMVAKWGLKGSSFYDDQCSTRTEQKRVP